MAIGTPNAFAKTVGRDVVVGRPNAAGREEIIVAAAQGIDGGDDIGLIVRNDADFAQPNADTRQSDRRGRRYSDLWFVRKGFHRQ